MSNQHDPVQPTPFDVAQPAPPEQPSLQQPGTGQGAPAWVLPALGALLLVALLVVFWLPSLISPDDDGTPEAAQEGQSQGGTSNGQPGAVQQGAVQQGAVQQGAVQQAPAAERSAEASPWSDAQAAKLRKEAQDVLAELLELQFELEERGVEQWSPEAYSAATTFAMAGDELYKQREYNRAKEQFELGLAGFQAIEAAIPDTMDQQLELARQAIEDGEAGAAHAALELAGLIEPENARLGELASRADALEQLLPLLQQAADAEKTGDLASAEQLLGQAAGIDPEHLRTRSELQRVAQAHRDQRFNDAMSDGYTALDDGQFSQARKAFRQAAKLRSGSSEAASALQEVVVAETAHKLATLKRRGENLEQKEQWQDAVAAYEQARDIDGNVLFSQQGLQRSVGRARLDKQFRTALEQPERLSDVAVAEALQQLLSQAEKITPRGPVLAGQIDRLQRVLEQANTPVAVTLRSDTETEVIVYKVARLGRFEQRELTLRPGQYTAVGTRNGYRDVRHDFTIRHDSAPAPILIACTEPI